MRDLLYEHIGKRKGERRYKHRSHAFGQESIIVAQCAILGVLDFDEQPQSSAQPGFAENARVFFQKMVPAYANAPTRINAAIIF
jgi:hypothetical protein